MWFALKKIRCLMIVALPILVFCIAFFAASAVSSVSHKDASLTETIEVEEVDCESEKTLYNILLLGEDGSERLTDVIMIVSCDTKNGLVNVLQLPRDTYGEYTSSSYRKINAASNVLGCESFAEFLSANLRIAIDGYVSLDVDVIAQAVDIIGGVEIDVPIDMSYEDPYQDLVIEIKKGKQILNGEKAKQFVEAIMSI